MKKPNDPLSAKKASATVGIREPKVERWPTGPVPEGEPYGYFTCLECRRSTPNENLGRENLKAHTKTCLACLPMRKPRKPSVNKSVKKRYQTGRLPKWMYS